jgi:hypothetical protein
VGWLCVGQPFALPGCKPIRYPDVNFEIHWLMADFGESAINEFLGSLL